MRSPHEKWIRAQLADTFRERASAAFAHLADDPVGFAEEVLGLTVWDRQREILESVRDNDRTIVVAGHKVSKSTSAIALALHWCAAAHPGRDTRVFLTAPSAHQVKNILWEELDKRLEAIERRDPKLRRLLGGDLPKDPTVGWRMASGAQIVGITTDKPERLAGLSGGWVLIIVDEGSGYRDDLFEALEGNEAGGAKLLALSNPTRPAGWFFDATTDGEWSVHRVPSTESPNVIAGERLIPGLATRGWVERMRRKYGPDPERNPVYQVRVMGVFPERAESQVVSLANINDAMRRWSPDGGNGEGRLRIGVDPARYGVDEAVVQAVRGSYAFTPRVESGEIDGPELAQIVIDEVYRLRRLPIDRTVVVRVDGVSVGASVVDALRYHPACSKWGDIVVEVHEGFRPAEKHPKRYGNLRSEAWFGLDEWLAAGGAIPNDRELRKELLGAKFVFDREQRQVLQDKDRMKKELGKSPNRADALTLAVSPIPHVAGDYESAQDFEDDLDDW